MELDPAGLRVRLRRRSPPVTSVYGDEEAADEGAITGDLSEVFLQLGAAAASKKSGVVFLLATRTRFVDAEGAMAALEAHQSSTAIAASTSASKLVWLAHARAVDLQEIAKIEGIDPVHGRSIELGIWMIRPKAAYAAPSLGRSLTDPAARKRFHAPVEP